MSAPRRLEIRHLGLCPYLEALAEQRRCVEARRAGQLPDTLLLLEHPPTITLGRRGVTPSLKHDEAALAARGVGLVQTERGGDVTYHGPGQWVGYVIMDLRAWGRGPRALVEGLEEVMRRAALSVGLVAHADAARPGLWLDDPPRKLGAVGLRVTQGITFHGFALNVNVDLTGFDLIVPCGIEGVATTSLAQALGRPLSMSEIANTLASSFTDVFDYALAEPWLNPRASP
ncbi:lipoyl(octanoyl) transferase LipB [Myxococcota bacterium]|nr:lipoyl(octanoyl) transferase LipB [Myxococcota bacterium]MBU1896727.1 lipoyl(octanoyl) transferase LipB [Myxococcota bacterium]